MTFSRVAGHRKVPEQSLVPERPPWGHEPDGLTVSKGPILLGQVIQTNRKRASHGAQGYDGAPLSVRLDLGHRHAVHARFFGKGNCAARCPE